MPNKSHRAPWHRAPIVLVEDDDNDVFFVRDALAKAKILNPLIACRSADEARGKLSGVRPVVPALFILDILLAGNETGLDFLQWLRSQPSRLGSTPTMMLTGSDRPEHRDATLELDALFFLQKPVRAAHLTEAIQTLGLVDVATGLVSGEMGFRVIGRP